MPYRRPPSARGPDLTEAPPTPWWHAWRRLRWFLVRRPRRDEARRRRLPRVMALLAAEGARLAQDMRRGVVASGMDGMGLVRPRPTEFPGPSRKVLL